MRVRLPVAALALGGAFVIANELLGENQLATPLPFWVLLPGTLMGALAPDSGFSVEGDTHPWGPISLVIVYTVNIAIYGGLAFWGLRALRRSRKAPV